MVLLNNLIKLCGNVVIELLLQIYEYNTLFFYENENTHII